jgi:hypothetical protein
MAEAAKESTKNLKIQKRAKNIFEFIDGLSEHGINDTKQ